MDNNIKNINHKEESKKTRFIIIMVVVLIIIALLAYFIFLKISNRFNIENYLIDCKEDNMVELNNEIQECKAFFNEDIAECELLEKNDHIERCKSSITNFKAGMETIESLSCDDLEADIAWCNAIKSNEIKFCEDIIDEKSEIFCKSKISGNISLCETIDVEGECEDLYNHQKAFLSEENILCDKISSSALKKACKANLLNKKEIDKITYNYMERKLFVLFSAFSLKSQDLCVDLEESNAKAMCLALVNIDNKECDNALNKDYCLAFYNINYPIYNSCIDKGLKSSCVNNIVTSSSF